MGNRELKWEHFVRITSEPLFFIINFDHFSEPKNTCFERLRNAEYPVTRLPVYESIGTY